VAKSFTIFHDKIIYYNAPKGMEMRKKGGLTDQMNFWTLNTEQLIAQSLAAQLQVFLVQPSW